MGSTSNQSWPLVWPELTRNESAACWQLKEPTETDQIAANDSRILDDSCGVDDYGFEIGPYLTGKVKKVLGVKWLNTSSGAKHVRGQPFEDAYGFSHLQPNNAYYTYVTSETVGEQSTLTRKLEDRVESIAISLTNYALEASGDTVLGYAISTETYVRVRWRWIIFPALLELGSLVLLILTIVLSRRKRVPIWKSSILAVIYHQVEGLGERETHVTERLSGMEASAKTAAVQLSSNQDGITVMSGRAIVRAME